MHLWRSGRIRILRPDIGEGYFLEKDIGMDVGRGWRNESRRGIAANVDKFIKTLPESGRIGDAESLFLYLL